MAGLILPAPGWAPRSSISCLSSSRRLVGPIDCALELDPDHYMSYYRYAMQVEEDSNLEEAERLIRRAIQLQPMSARFRTELAGILRLQGREEEAQAEMEKSRAFQADRTQQ